MNDKSKGSFSENLGSTDHYGIANGAQNQQTDWVETALIEHLDSRVENLDYNVTSKLSAARFRSLEAAAQRNRGVGGLPSWLSFPKFVAGFAVCALTVVLAFQLLPRGMAPADIDVPSQAANTQTGQMIEDLQLLSASDDIEFYESLEFLEWMQNNAG